MEDNKNQLPHQQVFDVSADVLPQGGSKWLDDDGRVKRTGRLTLHFAHFVSSEKCMLNEIMLKFFSCVTPNILLFFSNEQIFLDGHFYTVIYAI